MSEFLNYYRNDPNNLSFWFPKVKDCGIKVPECQKRTQCTHHTLLEINRVV